MRDLITSKPSRIWGWVLLSGVKDLKSGKEIVARWWLCMLLIPALSMEGEQRQEDLWEFETAWSTKQIPG